MNFSKQLKSATLSLSLLALISLPTFAVSTHDNGIKFYSEPGNGVYQITFSSTGSCSYTQGQPWNGVSSSNTGYNSIGYASLYIIANAGRQSSTPPAQFFAQNESACIAGISTDWGFNPSNTAPSQLNFAFTGIITISGQNGTYSYPITLGQGHNSSQQNNWWVGGPNYTGGMGCSKGGSIATPDGRYSIQSTSQTSVAAFLVIAN